MEPILVIIIAVLLFYTVTNIMDARAGKHKRELKHKEKLAIIEAIDRAKLDEMLAAYDKKEIDNA